MNDVEREQWINNDEFLYRDFQRSRLSMRRFLRKHRDFIDNYVQSILNRKPS